MHPDQASEPGSSRPGGNLALLTLLGVTALAYGAALRFGFAYDDFPQIVNNPRLTSWAWVPSYFTHHVWIHISASGTYYRPLFLLWLRLNEFLFGTRNPSGWHLTTLLLHLVAVALVFRLMQRTLPTLTAVTIATAIFALHPGHVESVGWISGCTEPLMACAFIGSLLCWMNRTRRNGVGWLLASWLLFLAALLVKETAIILPALVAVYAYGEEIPDKPSRLRGVIFAALPFAAIAAVEMLVRRIVLGGGVNDEPHAWTQVLATIPSAATFYLRHLLWPVRLSPFYDVFLVSKLSPAAIIGCIALVLLVCAGFIVAARRSQPALVALAWIVTPLIPAFLGLRLFDSTDVVHDRYLYLSTIGLGILAGLVVGKFRSQGARIFNIPAGQFVAASALMIAMVAGTTLELRPWADNLQLFLRGVQVAPKSPPAYNHLAFELYKRGNVETAEQLYKRSVALDPNDWPANFGLAVLEMRTQQWNAADHYFQRAIELKPLSTNATYVMQAQVRLSMGEAKGAEASMRTALDRWPDIAGQHLLLAQILVAEGRNQEAANEFRKELEIDPGSTQAQTGLAQLKP